MKWLKAGRCKGNSKRQEQRSTGKGKRHNKEVRNGKEAGKKTKRKWREKGIKNVNKRFEGRNKERK
jgi:hypothetical protein